MKRKIILLSILSAFTVVFFTLCSCNATGNGENKDGETNKGNNSLLTEPKGGVEMLNSANFIKKVFNFKKNQTWKFEGSKPCIVDFYADWCGPCKRVAPIMDELSKTYNDKVNFYKVNVDFEKELASAFNITSIPALLYCPMSGDPQMTLGLYAKDDYVKIIEEFLLKTNTKK